MKSIGRFLTIAGVVGTIAVVFVLYATKHDTRALDQRVRELERLVDRAETDVAVLRAEWGHLTEPRRIERLTRKHLGLAPMHPSQFGTAEEIALRGDGDLAGDSR